MKKYCSAALIAFLFTLCGNGYGSVEPGAGQKQYEQSTDGIVVRNKRYYKAGSLELMVDAGVMPYDSVINHVMTGGRLAWHITDHIAWEIADIQLAFPTVSSFTTDTVANNGISNLQTVEIKLLAGTNLLVSPIYGKIRFFGSNVVYYDIYAVGGVGAAHTNVLQFSSPGSGQAASEATLSDGFDPMFDLGLGFKFFINRAMGLVLDLRDYVVDSNVYGSRSLKSNYSVFVGLSFFLPPL